MRNGIVWMLVCFSVFALTGCASGNGTARTGDDVQTGILTEPPILTVVCNETSVEALKGGYSWIIKNKDGTATAMIADSAHPLTCKDLMQPLAVSSASLSDTDALIAYLQFESAPDTVLIRCWNETYWGQSDACGSGEALTAAITEEALADGRLDPEIKFTLKDGNYIYEIIAEWNRSNQFSGTAYYSFYTIISDLEQ